MSTEDFSAKQEPRGDAPSGQGTPNAPVAREGITEPPQHIPEADQLVAVAPPVDTADQDHGSAPAQTAADIRASAGISEQTTPVKAGPLVRLATSFTWPTWVLVAWVGLFLAIGAGLLAWVAVRQDGAIAYDVVTQHISPTDTLHPNFGPAEYLLGIFGYFVAPATIGAVVAGIFVSNSTMSDDRAAKALQRAARVAAKRAGKHRKEQGAHTPPTDNNGQA